MKKIFTLLLVIAFSVSFAQMGNIHLETKSGVSHATKDANGEILMPGDWATATQVGTYRWVDSEDDSIHLGWIFGNNTYGHQGSAMSFEVDAEMDIFGAYIWFGAAEPGDGDIHFRVMAFDGSIGDEIGSVSVPLDDIDELVTGEDVTPDMYDQAMYVEFDSPIVVDGDFAFVVDYGDVTWTAHGDGVGLASTVGTGAGEAWIMDETGTWVMATEINPGLTFDVGIFPHVADDNGEDPDGYEVTFFADMEEAEGFDPHEHRVFVTGNFADWAEPGTEGSLELEWVGKSRSDIIMYENFDGGEIPDGWLNLDENGDGNFWTIVTEPGHDPYDGDYAVASESWDGAPLTPDNWLITHQLTNVTDDWELSFFVKAQDPSWPQEKYDVLVSATGNDPDDFTSIHSETLSDGNWKEVVLSLETFAGEDIYIAFRHWDSTDMFQIVLDAIKVEDTGNGNGEDPEDLIYSGVAHFEGGELQYKYFSDLIGEGWDGGEWEGDPNRVVHVDQDIELHDVFGVQPDPVEEFTVTFVVEDEEGNAIEDAVVTFDGEEYAAGHYVIDGVEEGTYDYMVEKDGYITDDGTVEVDEDKTVEVMLVADDVYAGGPDDITLNIFPNPASDVFYIESDAQISEIRMFDVLGQVVYTGTANDTRHEISVGGIKAGIYFVQLTTEAGMVTQRVQVTR